MDDVIYISKPGYYFPPSFVNDFKNTFDVQNGMQTNIKMNGGSSLTEEQGCLNLQMFLRLLSVMSAFCS